MDKKKLSVWSNFFKFYAGKKLLKGAFMRLGLPLMKGRVLDLGAGWAPYSKEIKGAGVVTIDHDASRLPMAVGACTALPFGDNSFDSILCTEVLEHVSEPDEALKELARVVKPGGAVYATAPMLWCLHYEPYDFYRYTGFGLKHLFEKHGFRVDKVEPIGGFFTFFSMRFGEKFYNFLNKVFFFLPRGIRIFFIIPLVWPVGELVYRLSPLVERPSRKDVVSWAMVGVKRK
jgi:SAM-dependent methyltransferase